MPQATRRDPPAAAAMRWVARIANSLPRLVRVVARHWLLLANIVLGLQAIVPILAPAFMRHGSVQAGRLLYTLYSPLCHQLPERSFFLFGRQLTYSLAELESWLGPQVPLRYIGDPVLGYKTTVCQRDIATYAAMWVAGLAFVALRGRLRPLSLRIFALLSAPIAIDGFGQLLGLWESSALSRVLTGGLFGLACIWLAYPIIEAGMKDVVRSFD